MRKNLLFAISALVMCSMVSAQTTNETSEVARKVAKNIKEEGWRVAPGQTPLEKQLDKHFTMMYEYEDNGLPKYIMGDARATGGVYDAARMQALNDAKIALADMISTEVTALTESTISNKQISSEDAASINEAAQEVGTSLIAQNLGKPFAMIERYRQVDKKNVEVNVTVAYNEEMAMNMVKAIIRKSLEEKGKDLHEQLDKMWGSRKY